MRAALIAVLTASCLHAQDVPDGLSASDWSSIRAAYEAGRHQVCAVDGGHRARSPGQQWLAKFDGRGVAVQPDAGEWSWGLELAAFGFAGDERAVAAPRSVQAEGQRLTYHYDDTLDEWYVNDTRGLEHGYTLHTRPAGDGTLTFQLRVRGDLTPVIQDSGRDVVFQQHGATRLAYTGLHVFDADGHTLPARFSMQPHGLLLSIDERGARYPVTVDPVAQHAYLKASNTDALDFFGTAVAVSGDTVVIGAYNEDSNATGVNGNQGDNSQPSAGAAYVFVRSGAVWSQQAYLKASNTDAGDYFGWSVAVSGDTVVVGALAEDSAATGVNGNRANNGALNSGAAYVFVRSGSSWSQQAYLKASNTNTDDLFGHSVAVSGDTVVIAAPEEDSSASGNPADNSASNAGAAYVFVRSGSSWSQQAYVKASNAEAGDNFGQAVAVSGDTIVVGADEEDSNTTGVNGSQADNSAGASGAAYVFVRSGTAWSQQAYLKASNTDASDSFGHSVALSGDTIVIGANGEDSNATGVDGNGSNNGAAGAGAAYVFVRNGTSWSQQVYLKASNSEAGDQFGISVAVADGTVVVGAYHEDSNATGINGNALDNSSKSAGAAYVFERSGTTWTQRAYLKASNTGTEDLFGYGVAISGSTVVVSAWGEDSPAFSAGPGIAGSPFDDTASYSGSVYVFDLRSGGVGSLPAVAQQAYLKASNTDVNDYFGTSVAVSGDTVVVGAPLEASDANGVNGNQTDNSTTRAGAAYVFVRSGTTWTQQAYLKASNSNSYDYFGYSVSVSGDTIVVGAYGEDSNATTVNGNQANNSSTRAGAAYVFLRELGVWSQQAYLKASNTNALDLFGWSVAVSGDTIVVSAYGEGSIASGVNGNQADNSSPDAGAAYVFTRFSNFWTQQAYLKASNSNAGDQFGYAVAMSGDTIVVGAHGEASNATGVDGNPFNNSAAAAGAAYVFARSGAAWSQQAYLKASNTDAGDRFGTAVAVSGNTVVCGAHEEGSNATGVNGNPFDNSAAGAGAAYVFVRNGALWSPQAYLKASHTDAGDYFGGSVAVWGDTIAIGAYQEDSSATGVHGNPADNSAGTAGAAYLYRRCGNVWTQRTYLKASNTGALDYFGRSIALSDDLLVVGAIGEASNATTVNGTQANNSAPFSGATYTFSIAQSRPSLWPLNAPQIGSNFTLAIDNLEPTFNFAVLVFGFVQLPLPGIDLGPILGMPCCDLYHTPDAFFSVAPGAGGSATWTWTSVSGLPGDTFYCQALCFDPLANTFGFTLSNQVTIRLVP